MLADDAAARRFGAGPLRSALTAMGGAADALVARTQVEADGRDSEAERRRRLDRLEPGAGGSVVPLAVLRLAVYALALSVLVLPTVVVVVPWLAKALPDWPL
jgi:hypothetical protein